MDECIEGIHEECSDSRSASHRPTRGRKRKRVTIPPLDAAKRRASPLGAAACTECLGKKIQDEAVTPTVQAGQPSDDDLDDNGNQPKEDEPLNKALELLKAKNG